MRRHICLKEWINGNELSISIDDNLCAGFRANIIIFKGDAGFNAERIEVDEFAIRDPTDMADTIIKAKKICEKNKGTVKPFASRILTDNESLEE